MKPHGYVRLFTSILTAVAVCACAQTDDPKWEVRRAHAGDQTDEWTQLGRVPAWQVNIGPGESPLIEVTGDEATGAFRGTVLIGRRWTVSDPAPWGLQMKLEYQTFCAMSDPNMLRSGQVGIAIFTPEGWEMYSTDPVTAEKRAPSVGVDGVLATFMVHGQGEDVTEWREWETSGRQTWLRDYAGQQVVIAITWSTAHFCEEWAKFRGFEVTVMDESQRERELLEAINPDYPGLERFKDAMAAGDTAGAKAAFVEHLRTREYPVGPPLSPDGSQGGINAADEIVDHVFRFVGCPPTKLEDRIRWNEDPHNYDQWAIALNRHTHWVTLGRAYAATGDEKYAKEFAAQLNGWIDAMPVHIGTHWVQGPFFQTGKSPLTLDAGIRMAHSWWPAYHYFKDSPNFDVASQMRMVQSFYDHAKYLMDPTQFRPSSNWGAMEVNGLCHIAVMLPEFRDASEWLETARARLVEALKAQVYPDGAQIELSTGYHGVTLSNFVGALELAKRNNVELPEELVSGLEKMYEYYAAIAMPNGTVPALNDASYSSVRNWLTQGQALFPERDDFTYVATGGREGTAPERISWHMPYAGWNIMRTGWRPADKYLMFENGPFGAGHQHEDKLGIVVHAGGKTILPDAGNYSYDSSEWRRYVLDTRAHNTVMVDGLEQRQRTQRDTFVVWEPEDNRWISNEAFDFAEGVYRSGYGPSNEVKVSHTRQIMFVKPGYWLVMDAMEPQDDGEHVYEALFHFDVEDVDVDEATGAVTAEYGDAGFRIVPLGGVAPEVEIIKGQTEPVVQGWIPTGQHNVLRSIPTAVFRWRAAGKSTLGFALIPRDRGAGWPVGEVRSLPAGPAEIAGQIALANGMTDHFVRRAAEGSPGVFGRLGTDAEIALVRVDGDGKVVSVAQIGGSELTVTD